MKLLKKTKKNKEAKENKIIQKSKEIIKKEKAKIKAEKQKQRKNKQEKFFKTKFGNFIKKNIFVKNEKEYVPPTLKSQILSIVYYEIAGAVLCLFILFALSGGKNYFKLYHELYNLIDTYDTITSEYYGDLDKQELIDNAISSMVEGTKDSFTNYSDEETTNEFMETVNGTYEGIGASVMMNEKGNIIIAEIFKDSPSEEAGLKVNDIVLKADGTEYKDSNSLANYIKGSLKEKIVLTISRENEQKEITIIRKQIETPTVSIQIIEKETKKIGYIKISIFSSVTTKQFEQKLKELEKNNIDGLIIDVRNNNGGYLSTVSDITNLFLKKGKIIYQLKDENGTEKIKDDTKEKRTYPITVLVNKASASASEILASAIKESYGGYVVGTNTYGKGTVQKTKKLKDGSMIKYTIQNWLTPNGNWINEQGVEPTTKVELDLSQNIDNQLETAVDILLKDLNK